MKVLKKISFVLGDFQVGKPAQQLLDRFLVGYPRDGQFHRVENCEIGVHVPAGLAAYPELDRRVKDWRLIRHSQLQTAVASADGVIIVPPGQGSPEPHISDALQVVPAESCCFVHGPLGRTLDSARNLLEQARKRGVQLLAGTSVAVTWRLPEIALESGTPIAQALIVVHGPTAELDGLDGLLPLIETRKGAESDVVKVRVLTGNELWQTGADTVWPWDLLSAALSRSDSPQGGAVTDGRTEDLVGLGLVPKLARHPRGWVMDFQDGLRATILALDGVVDDVNFALKLKDGTILSAQLFRPPPPAQHEFSRLAAVLEDFFRSATPPWRIERSLRTAELLEAFAKSSMP